MSTLTMPAEMLNIASDKLLRYINEARPQLLNIHEADWVLRSQAGNWCKKEIIGHLIDSAANNHIRFIRAQLAESTYISYAYEQNFFVSSQKYTDCNPVELIELWYVYNRHLAHVIRQINISKLNTVCVIGKNPAVSLSFLITDYINHLRHHLRYLGYEETKP